MLFFFVDDIIIIYDRRHVSKVDEFQAKLFKRYEMRYLGEAQWFLGIKITRDRDLRRLILCQDSYIDKVLAKFNIKLSARGPASPLDNAETLIKNTGQADPQDTHAYQQRIGSVNFAAVDTRPDIAFASSKLSGFMTNPSSAHQIAAERVLHYMGHTKYYSIVFDAQVVDPRKVFLASSDAAYGDDPGTRCSSQGYGFMLFNGMIDWRASKQKTVTLSSTESELLAITATAREILWWDRFFDEISLDTGHSTLIECDNMQTMRIIQTDSTQFTTKLRHVDIHRLWLRQEVRNKNVNVKWTASAKILADGFTKALAPLRHREFIALLGLQNIKPNQLTNSNSSISSANALTAGIPSLITQNGTPASEEDTDYGK